MASRGNAPYYHAMSHAIRPRRALRVALRLACCLAVCVCPWVAYPPAMQAQRDSAARAANQYDALIKLFGEWRGFQRPRLVGGAPDYSRRAMAAQHAALPAWRRRLAAVDTSGWTIARQVDWHLVRAEMNGLDFDHRVLRPWANNPAFYLTVFPSQSDQPAREGHQAFGAVELWRYRFPLTPEDADRLGAELRAVPPLLAAARTNLAGDGRDLWAMGVQSLRGQAATLAALVERLAAAPGTVRADAERAREATEALAAWVERQAARKTGLSGVGVANYDWYLRHVQLLPYTWADEVAVMERELARARAYLALEERRNEALPPLAPVASAEEHARRFAPAVDEYVAFLRDRDLLTVKDWMAPALRERLGSFTPGPREFFTEVDYRDPVVMRTHGYHWFDLARLREEPHASPVRRGPLLYNIFVTRTEGLATGWEEMALGAGLFDARPRSRELVYVLLAQRAARALGDLRQHANQLGLEAASAFTAANTPRGWLRMEGRLVRGEQHLYLQQPAYGTSYVIGKVELERLLSDRAQQLGDRFTMRGFMDELDAAGLIPTSLLRWQLTGRLDDDVRRVLGGR